MQTSLADKLNALLDRYSIELPESEQTLMEAFRVRYQVYRIERQFLAGQDGIETDIYDQRSRHIVIRDRTTRDVVGTARLVLNSPIGFPMTQVCPDVVAPFDDEHLAELSRFSISKRSVGQSGLLRLLLVRGLVQLSEKVFVTHLCAIMERPLIRLMAASGIRWQEIGPEVEYHGFRQPCHMIISDMLAEVELLSPDIWCFLTGKGAG